MAKKESTFLNMVLTLFIITGVASLALGAIYNLTKGPIEMAKKAKLEAAIKKVVPDFENIKKFEVLPDNGKDSLTFYQAVKQNEIVGTAIKTYTDKGFSGRFWIMVGFLPDGTIYNTAVLEHKETPGLGDKMEKKKSDWSKQFSGKNPANYKLRVTKDGGDVDAITAATISSRAFCNAVKRAYNAYQKEGGNK
ncbi:MAG: RnfABCDGE type electron transport complex subunit G [Bacteroidales bacterium]|nr:RnfABCDGE type electron transport complex subunit G [Bacteroidales bacterium]